MLTGKQKRYLRSLVVTEPAIVHIGKGGITDNLLVQLQGVLEARELVKIKLLPNTEVALGDAAAELSHATGSELVQTIGKNVVLYRRSKEPKIELP